MAKEEVVEMNGVVAEALPDGRYRVRLDNGHDLAAYSPGKMRKHRIWVIAGDKVSWRSLHMISARGGSPSAIPRRTRRSPSAVADSDRRLPPR
jgi:translation initiation factor IF-1